MRAAHIAVVTISVVFAATGVARADGFITPHVGFNFGGDSANCASFSRCEEKRANWGVSFGAMHGIFGIEEDIGYAPSFFGDVPGGDNAVLTAMTDVLLVVPAGPIQPYGLIGLGLIRPHITFDTAALTAKNNALGYDIGGGLNIFFARRVGLRGELRRFHTLQNVKLSLFSGERLDFWRASAGITFRF